MTVLPSFQSPAQIPREFIQNPSLFPSFPLCTLLISFMNYTYQDFTSWGLLVSFCSYIEHLIFKTPNNVVFCHCSDSPTLARIKIIGGFVKTDFWAPPHVSDSVYQEAWEVPFLTPVQWILLWQLVWGPHLANPCFFKRGENGPTQMNFHLAVVDRTQMLKAQGLESEIWVCMPVWPLNT